MRLIFLGTGPAFPIPRFFCHCAVCTDAQKTNSKSRRSRSVAMVEMNGKKLLIDAGPDILHQLATHLILRIDAVLLTHAHADAAAGIQDLNEALAKQQCHTTLFVESGTLRRIDGEFQEDHWMDIKKISSGKSFQIGSVSVTPFRVAHSMTKGFPTLGYRIGCDLVYASDVSAVPKNSERFIRGVNHLVLDGCMWFGTQIKSHLTVNRATEFAERMKVKNLYLTQISHTYPPYQEAVRKIQEFCKKQKVRTKVILAHDDLQINIK